MPYLVVFSAGCISTENAPDNLTQNPWILAYFVGGNICEQPLEGSVITLAFAKDMSYSGNGGINNYQGTYTVSGNKPTLGGGETRLYKNGGVAKHC